MQKHTNKKTNKQLKKTKGTQTNKNKQTVYTNLK